MGVPENAEQSEFFESNKLCMRVIPYFFNQTLLLLFISLLVLCGYYSRVAFISLESLETSTAAG